MDVLYTSTKEYPSIGPVNYRQWRADSHCKYWHGYALTFKFWFEADTLDARNWVMDYGGLRPLKDLLEDWFDHKTLVAEDDPELEFHKEAERRGLCRLTIVERTGCEGIADFLLRYVNDIFLPLYGDPGRVTCRRVSVRETANNMAYAELTAELKDDPAT